MILPLLALRASVPIHSIYFIWTGESTLKFKLRSSGHFYSVREVKSVQFAFAGSAEILRKFLEIEKILKNKFKKMYMWSGLQRVLFFIFWSVFFDVLKCIFWQFQVYFHDVWSVKSVKISFPAILKNAVSKLYVVVRIRHENLVQKMHLRVSFFLFALIRKNLEKTGMEFAYNDLITFLLNLAKNWTHQSN